MRGGKTSKAEVKRHGIPYRCARGMCNFRGCGAAAAWNLFDYMSGVLYACGVTPKPSLLEPCWTFSSRDNRAYKFLGWKYVLIND
jgi:hypothetical protein